MTDRANGPLRALLVAIWRYVAPRKWFMPFLVFYVRRRLRPLNGASNSAERIRLLVLNAERMPQDLEVLGEHADVELMSLPSDVQALINSIFYWRTRALMSGNAWDSVRLFHHADHPVVAAARNDSYAYLCRFLPALARRARLHAMISCSFFYRQDIEWQRAGATAGFPFFALHKENMQDEAIQANSIAHYRGLKFRFHGERLFVFNRLVKHVLVEAGVCPESRAHVAGAVRLDRIYRRRESGRIADPKRQVVLFSFHHAIGLLKLSDKGEFFSDDPNTGFVEYFDLVHVAIARLAREHPDVSFIIKPKWGGPWCERIGDAIRRVIALDPDELPNLTIDETLHAQNLIETSSVVVGVNSTTLLEAKLIGRRVVIPLFAEAAGKYYDDHIYFKKYLDSFRVARSPTELEEAIMAQLDEREPWPPPMPPQMIEDFLGILRRTRLRPGRLDHESGHSIGTGRAPPGGLNRDNTIMKRRICIVITARASYARIKTVLEAVNDHPDIELALVVGASALLDRFGSVIDVIRADGFRARRPSVYGRRG